MQRQQATQLTRQLMDQHGLNAWKIRLVTDINSPFLGRCDFNHKCIYINAHHVDIHHEELIKDTILHEIAHALVGYNEGHNDVWRSKAKEIGSHALEACAGYGLSPAAIDAIRSGNIVEVDYEEEVIRKPITRIHKFSDLCPECGKVAKTLSECKFTDTNGVEKQFTALSCGHIITKIIPKATPFHEFITQGQGDANCKHVWDKTKCVECGACKLYPFQVDGCLALEQGVALHRGFGLFDEMGLGKTVMPLAYLHFHPEKLPFLWFGKSGIKYQYFKEIIRWLGPKHFPQVIQTGKDMILPGLSGYIMSYDMARRFDKDKLKEIGIKTIILDECQAVKNPDSTRTSEVRALCQQVETIIPTSGTPWKNRGSEFFVALNMLDPKKFYSFEAFKRQWVQTYWEGAKLKEGGINNPEKFREYIKPIAIRRERKEVMPELPLVNRTKQFCTVDEHARKAYNSIVKQLIETMNDAEANGESGSFETRGKIQQSLMQMRQIVGIAKVPSTLAYVENFIDECDRKLVIFVHHRACAKAIFDGVTELCKDTNIKVLTLSADHSSERRMQIQQEFNGPQRTIMIASTLASGEGLNLQTCSDCIMHERQWNPANEEQAEGRFIRIGQTAESVNAIYIEAEESVDSDFGNIVETKRKHFIQSMGTDPNYIPTWDEGDIIKQLIEKSIERYNKTGGSK